MIRVGFTEAITFVKGHEGLRLMSCDLSVPTFMEWDFAKDRLLLTQDNKEINTINVTRTWSDAKQVTLTEIWGYACMCNNFPILVEHFILGGVQEFKNVQVWLRYLTGMYEPKVLAKIIQESNYFININVVQDIESTLEEVEK